MSDAAHPLLYLRRRELANTARLALRSRRHRVGLLLFALLLAVLVGEPLLLVFGASPRQRFGANLALGGARGALALWFVLHTLQWLRAALSERVLLLPRAHYDFLFPAPIGRRSLVLNHLAGSYVPFLWGSPTLALPIVAAAGAWFPGYQPLYFGISVATFVLFDLAAFNLVTLGAVLVHGRAGARRPAPALLRALLGGVSAAILALVLWQALIGQASALAPATRALLAPFFLLADLTLAPIGGIPALGAPTLAALALVAGGSLLLLVDRFAAATEPGRDAVSGLGVSAAATTWTRGLRPLQAEGALVWKTLLALRRSAGRLLLVVGLGVAGLTATAVLGSPRLLALVAPAAFLLYYSLLAETLFAVFVADLERPDLLRPLPLRPWRALAASLGVLTAVGVAAGWLPLLAAWLAYRDHMRGWLVLAAAVLPLLLPLVFLARGTLLTLFPPQREAETLDLIYAAAVELAALVVTLVVVGLPLVALLTALLLGASVVAAWLASAAVALPLGALLAGGLMQAYRARTPPP